MANSSVPTLTLDGRNWKNFQANLLEVAAMKGLLGVLSGQEPNPTLISIPTKKPIEASSDDETQESCAKPNELSVEPPSEERLEDGLTESKLQEQPSSRAGKPLESEHLEVLNGMAKMLDKVENVDKMAHKDLPLKPCDRSTTNDLPSVQELPLEGEQALCMSASTMNSQSSHTKELQLTIYSLGGTLEWPMAGFQKAEMDEGGC
ncbi:hypothetical protein F5141DRAFT_1066125 [Pisolithus sp. B1]|nr:hypothetical protein F5141DRAFT_1066125 [Pisolithus sp. B1]